MLSGISGITIAMISRALEPIEKLYQSTVEMAQARVRTHREHPLMILTSFAEVNPPDLLMRK
jgi:hypothetical protein